MAEEATGWQQARDRRRRRSAPSAQIITAAQPGQSGQPPKSAERQQRETRNAARDLRRASRDPSHDPRLPKPEWECGACGKRNFLDRGKCRDYKCKAKFTSACRIVCFKRTEPSSPREQIAPEATIETVGMRVASRPCSRPRGSVALCVGQCQGRLQDVPVPAAPVDVPASPYSQPRALPPSARPSRERSRGAPAQPRAPWRRSPSPSEPTSLVSDRSSSGTRSPDTPWAAIAAQSAAIKDAIASRNAAEATLMAATQADLGPAVLQVLQLAVEIKRAHAEEAHPLGKRLREARTRHKAAVLADATAHDREKEAEVQAEAAHKKLADSKTAREKTGIERQSATLLLATLAIQVAAMEESRRHKAVDGADVAQLAAAREAAQSQLEVKPVDVEALEATMDAINLALNIVRGVVQQPPKPQLADQPTKGEAGSSQQFDEHPALSLKRMADAVEAGMAITAKDLRTVSERIENKRARLGAQLAELAPPATEQAFPPKFPEPPANASEPSQKQSTQGAAPGAPGAPAQQPPRLEDHSPSAAKPKDQDKHEARQRETSRSPRGQSAKKESGPPAGDHE